MDIENNRIVLVGEVVKESIFSHQTYGEKFYQTTLKVERISGYADELPITYSDRLIPDLLQVGSCVAIDGQIRSFNKHMEDGKTKLLLSAFCREIEEIGGTYVSPESNQVELTGYICKPPVYRKTPLGRDIADILVASNRSYGKSDYIPCICWGRNAQFASRFEAGNKVKIAGRWQSREYKKKYKDGSEEIRTAYELSVTAIELWEEEDGKSQTE